MQMPDREILDVVNMKNTAWYLRVKMPQY